VRCASVGPGREVRVVRSDAMACKRALFLLTASLLPVVLLGTALRAFAQDAPAADERASLQALLAESVEHHHAAQLLRSASEPLRRWTVANAAALDGLTTSSLGAQPWGRSAFRERTADAPARVYLYVFDWHVSGSLVVYGLTGGMTKAYLLADPAKSALPAGRVGSSTVLTVPKDPPDKLATVVVLELSGERPEITDIVARRAAGDAGGRILMHARDAVIHGHRVRYEPDPHKDTVGYWTDPADWVSWDFEIAEPGTYAVEILQGCGAGSGGSEVNFAVGDQVLPVTVQDTGGFQNFVARGIGTFTFDKPGRYTLAVKPVKKPGAAVMDLRSVTLTKAPSATAKP
jgi:hypothetical protein